MNPQEMLPRLNALLGPEIAEALVDLATRHKTRGAEIVRIPSHVIVILLEALAND